MKILSSIAIGALLSLACEAEAKTKPPPYAYATLGNGDFGVVNLSNGAFVLCGNSGFALVGMAVAPNGTLIGQSPSTDEIYSVNPGNGALTAIGPSGVSGAIGLGSSLSTIFNILSNGSVYTIDPTTGAGTKIGEAGVPIINAGQFGVSNGKATFYASNDLTLNSVKATTGKFKVIGNSSVSFGALLYTNKMLYGGTDDAAPFAIYTVNPKTGASTFVANLQSDSTNPIYGLVATSSSGCAQ